MALTSLCTLLLVATLAQVSRALPIPPHRQYTIYTPNWSQGLQQVNCDTIMCNSVFPRRTTEQTNIVGPMKINKRTRSQYKTGWTMAGMPFSVLYMSPKKAQLTAHEPVAELLKSVPLSYEDNNHILPEPETSLDSLKPAVIPSRKQYSIIPQLFVSYGWRPLGK